jgi:hypothetical protein
VVVDSATVVGAGTVVVVVVDSAVVDSATVVVDLATAVVVVGASAAEAVVVGAVFADALLHALTSAAPPASAISWRREINARHPVAASAPGALVCCARFVMSGPSPPSCS